MTSRIPSGDPIDEQFIKRLLVLAAVAAVLLAVSVWLERRDQ